MGGPWCKGTEDARDKVEENPRLSERNSEERVIES